MPQVSKPQRNPSTEAEAARSALQTAVGRRIHDVRLAVGLGQAECARTAGIDTSSMFRIETGAQNLTLDTLARVALALDVPMDELLTGVRPDPAIIQLRTRG
ncbi:helix-turn-helix transcriptional regulator [Sphingomonas sp. 2SG]|uniref:helix-turn-helix domain-containing protein n=1 Tax=Sphingomonas sp. 2SG TaxID=2502201 RepID=UPI0014854C4B|nr:helix-turn-helix transcriptional regulator [Sphingomonas sp. 2SG]